jgi:hypothetical protein
LAVLVPPSLDPLRDDLFDIGDHNVFKMG